MSFDRLIDILKQAQTLYPSFSQRMKEAEALRRWDDAVGTVISKHTRVLRIQNGVMWIEVDHPVWKSELHHRKRQILDLLNSKGLPPPVASPEKKNHPTPKSSESTPEVIHDLFFIEPRKPGAGSSEVKAASRYKE